MHELSLAQSVVEIVEEAARREGAARVASVRLELGELSHVEPESLAFAFEVAAREGSARGARLEFLRVPGHAMRVRDMEIL